MFSRINTFMDDLDIKIRAIFIFLLVSNILLFGLLVCYSYDTFKIDINLISSIVTFCAALIVLGYLVTRLSKFKEYFGENSYVEVIYLLIFGILSMTVSFFNTSSNGAELWEPFLNMFKILSVMIILTLIATRLSSFKQLVEGKLTIKNQIIALIIFSIIGIFASYFVIDVNGVPANVRDLVVVIGGFLGGPFVGIGSALISGIWRFSMGGITALPCAIATIFAGVFGSLIYYWNNKKFLGLIRSSLFIFLFLGFDMLIIILLTPLNVAFSIVNNIYLPMAFGAVLGMILFSMMFSETKNHLNNKENN